MTNGTPDVTILICLHNEEKNIENLIQNIANQADQNFDIVFVDDRSTDETYAVLQQKIINYKGKIIKIETTPHGWGSKKWAVNQGLKHVNTEWVLTTDADCFPNEHWVQNMKKQMSPDVDFVIGISPYFFKNGLLNFIIRQETLQTAFLYLGSAASGFPYMGVARNMAYRKKIISESEIPFKEVLSGDDDLFIQYAKNNKVNLEIESAVYSTPQRSWKHWIQQKRRHLSAGKKYKFLILSALTAFHLNHLIIYICLIFLVLQTNFHWVIFAYLFKNIFLWFIQKQIFTKSNIKFSFIEFLIWDFVQMFYQMFIFFLGILPQTKKWR